MKKSILYIHGFNSSPLSLKAEQTRQYLAINFPSVNFVCPQLATTPAKAIAQLVQIMEQEPDTTWGIVGSSLGGYFANYLSEKYHCLAVLVNPAIRPYELLQDYIGEQVNPYTEEVYTVHEDYIQQLKSVEQVAPSFDSQKKNNYLIMVQTGDEVLNYQDAVEKYQHCRLIVQAGGDHSFINFDKCLPSLSDFLQLG